MGKANLSDERRGGDGPVYVVETLDGTGRERVLHQDLLLPCPYLVDEWRTADVHLGRKKMSEEQVKTGSTTTI